MADGDTPEVDGSDPLLGQNQTTPTGVPKTRVSPVVEQAQPDIDRDDPLLKAEQADEEQATAAAYGVLSGIPGARTVAPVGGVIGSYVDPSNYPLTGSPLERYRQGSEMLRSRGEQAESAYPKTAIGSSLASGIATIPSAPGTALGKVIGTGVDAALPSSIRIGKYLGPWAGQTVYGGALGAGGAYEEGGDPWKGALWGAAAPAGIGIAGAGVQKYFGRVVDPLLDQSGVAQEKFSPSLQRAQDEGTGALTEQQWKDAQARGQPVMLGDLGDQETRDMLRAIGNKYPDATQTMRTALRDRNLTQATRFNKYVKDALFPGQDLNTAAADDQRMVDTRAMNSRNYQQAYDEGKDGVWDQNLAHMLRYPQVQSVLGDAQQKATKWALDNRLDPPPSPFQQNRDGTWGLKTNPDGSQATPSLMYWDQIKRSLDGAAQKAGIGTENARDWVDLKNQLTGYLDANPSIPSYAQARKGAFAAFNTDKASEAATNFLGADEPTAGRQIIALGKMSAPDREVFARTLAAQIRQAAASPNEARNISTMFNNDDMRAKFRAGLNTASDPNRAEKIETYMKVESAMNQLEGAFGNSTTTRQQLTAQLAEPGGHTGQPSPFVSLARHALGDIALGGVMGTGEAAAHGIGLGTAAASFGAVAFNEMMQAASAGLNKRVVKEVSQRLTSQNPDDVRQAMEFVAKTPKMMDALRRVENSVSFWGGANQQKFHPLANR
jgi:hypothetical protein